MSVLEFLYWQRMSSADEREKGRPVTRVSQGGKYIPMDFSLVGGARGEGGGMVIRVSRGGRTRDHGASSHSKSSRDQ
jgi:hypothetical protein